jgi:hypothetical protein
MKKIGILFGFWSMMTWAFAQNPPPVYHTLIQRADSLYETKQYLNAGLTFSAAFQAFGGLGFANHRYNAACSWALAGNADSAFYNLQRIVDRAKYADYQQITSELDLIAIHQDPRWQALLLQVKQNKDQKENGSNKPLFHLLDSMQTVDQKWRNSMTKFRNGQLQDDTLSEETILRNILQTDSLNYFLLQKIFDQYGFPNYDVVGENGSNSFWLLVQHQDRHPSFQDSVLIKMKIEVDAKKASSGNYAYLVDRVKVNKGQEQVYGTQMELNPAQTSYVPKSVIDPEKLNERRFSVGLGSIESYIEQMNTRNFGALKKSENGGK